MRENYSVISPLLDEESFISIDSGTQNSLGGGDNGCYDSVPRVVLDQYEQSSTECDPVYEDMHRLLGDRWRC